MSFKFYPKPNGDGYSPEEIKAGQNWIYADVVCDVCGKDHHCSEEGKPCHSCGSTLRG